MHYRNCGDSGLKLPVLSWHNFGKWMNQKMYASFDAGNNHLI